MSKSTPKNRVNWSVRQGASLIRLLRVRDRDQPFDLTGQTIKCAITDRRGSVVSQLTPESGGLVVDLPKGEIQLKLSSVVTDGLSPTSYNIQLDIAAEANFPVTFLEGDLSVYQGAVL
ncbi:hypothetical protein [Kiloniella majae]|uniref:hypothetical protein n=1 Tax=Kiloniella majae TaxID=1938558 RepID=UPI000A277A9A|nr:hypothetical protein [Kiloniella majae]